ncbi:MAG: thioredoxin domain-containing protein [Lachnospiraceae bacterium]|nr:thioredoxin domain-containing protein [Lachnospiraceae bacterium]
MHAENRKPNHLIKEKSPYLLQHAYNPVNWYPWSKEAFAKAKEENKPIFLSIGYSTCHWCHVMERESFEDEEVAEVLNRDFVAIKVDKEERPDIDTIYMNVCQAVNGHGGWPLTIIMTPEQKPFFAGTYLPKHSKGQMFGLIELLNNVSNVWKADPKRLIDSGEDITRIMQKEDTDEKEGSESPSAFDRRTFARAFLVYQHQFDEVYGGFREAPKFPTPHNLMFLLRYAVLFHNDSALRMVEKTLEGMFRGGIYDHIGGGFSRYSTDEKWLVPHFEKMLYDNALLIQLYSEAYQVTKRPLYEKVVKESMQYIMTEMLDDKGGFYCAQDADSEGEEGRYYVFTPEEAIQVLGKSDGARFNQYYKIKEPGNFEGATIPNRIGMDLDEDETGMKQLREKMYEYRKGRMALHKDDKILTSWNSLMITACAKAYQVFHEKQYLFAARDAYAFIVQNLRDENGRLAVRYRDGHRFGLGNLEDYAFFIMAQIALYEVTFDPVYLAGAVKDADEMIRLFWDEKKGGFYFYGSDAESLILRPKEVYDGAIPSGNSVAAYALVKLEKITRKDSYWNICEKQFDFLTREISEYPIAYSFALCAFLIKMDPKEIVCVLNDDVDLQDLHQLLREYFLPTTVVIPIEEHYSEELAAVAPYTAEYKRIVEESEIYICENLSCHPPIKGMEGLKEYFEKITE